MRNLSPLVSVIRGAAASSPRMSVAARSADDRARLPVWTSMSSLRSCALQAAQPVYLVEDDGVLQYERVAGGDGLGLGCGQHGGVDLLDLAGVDLSAHELRERCGLPLDGLPHVGVEGTLGDVADDRHFLVLVALPHDASVALRDVGEHELK